MQDFRNISPMSDLAWSGVGFPPLFLFPNVRKRKQPTAQNRGAPGGGRGRGSIIINPIMMEKQESSPRFGRAPGFVFVTARLGPIRRAAPMDRQAH